MDLKKMDFTVVMIPYFAEVIVADISDHIRMLRFDAMKRVQTYLHHYEKLGYIPKLLCAIAEKKCEYIRRCKNGLLHGNERQQIEMFQSIAPYVQDGSYIWMIGEDGSQWRWVFQSGVCREVNAKVEWREE